MPLEDTPPIAAGFNNRSGAERGSAWSIIAGDKARIAQMRAIEARHARIATKLILHQRKHRQSWVGKEVAKLSKQAPRPELRPDGARRTKADIERQAAINVAARIKARRDRLFIACDNTIKRQVLSITPDGRVSNSRSSANRQQRRDGPDM
ncbi:hypothetical protein [Maricaulis alexandrii]|uniref:hypothetical protein n=1 Tax=Maricaulis alexandrii TaxID=2570354 RepID=UPI001108D612|nr:hypothetical protein [Maricaulis alexandrii]